MSHITCHVCGSNEHVDEPTPSDEEIDRWIMTLMRRLRIRVHTFDDGTRGLLNVPAKYVAAIDTLHIALVHVARGDGLPDFEPEPVKPIKEKR